MIIGLRGKVDAVFASSISLDVNGTMYEVFLPLSVFGELSIKDGIEVFLHIHHHISESNQRLFGFSSKLNREFFIALQSIKGLGPALALSLLSHFTPVRLLEICSTDDVKSLTKIPKIGKSTSESLVFEINRRQKKWAQLLEKELSDSNAKAVKPSDAQTQIDLACQALIQLGYKESEATKTLEKIMADLNPDELKKSKASELIAACLKLL